MCTRYLSGLLLMMTLPAWAQDGESDPPRQLNAVQAQLQSLDRPNNGPTAASAPTVMRLVGRMLSEQVKGLSLGLGQGSSSDAGPAASAAETDASTWRFNHHAEICYDNYRVGLRRDGLVMRYELSF